MQDAAAPSPDLFQEGLAAARNGWMLWTAWSTPSGAAEPFRLHPKTLSIIIHHCPSRLFPAVGSF